MYLNNNVLLKEKVRLQPLTSYYFYNIKEELTDQDKSNLLKKGYEEIRSSFWALSEEKYKYLLKNEKINLNANLDEYLFTTIDSISEEYLAIRNGQLVIKNEHLENTINIDEKRAFTKEKNQVLKWNYTKSLITPEILRANFFSKREGDSLKKIRRKNISSVDPLLEKKLNKGISEQHLHMSAARSLSDIWLEVLGKKNQYLKAMKILTYDGEVHLDMLLKVARVIRILIAKYLMSNNVIEFNEFLSKECSKHEDLNKIIIGLIEGKNFNNQEINFSSLEGRLVLNRKRDLLDNFFQKSIKQDPISNIFYKYYDYNKENKKYSNVPLDGEAYITPEELFLEMSFKRVREEKGKSVFKKVFAQYIRIRNIFYQTTVQGEKAGKGLGVFKGINGNQKLNLNTDDSLFKVLVEQTNNQNLLKLEVRTTPKADKNKAIKGLKVFFLEYLKFLTGGRIQEVDIIKKGVPLQLGITYHFIKSKEEGIECAITNKNEPSIGEVQAKIIKQLLQEVEGLDNYIVGIDAASNEIGTTPTTLFKAYKVLRDDDLYTENSIGFTYHVGEEFSDILSGLRAVDEVVEGLNYRPGDRIGHGIVLGIDVDKWYADNQIIYLEAREYLENLIWLRHLYIQEIKTPTISISYLESKIYSLVKKILGFNKGIDLNTLTEIYLDKIRGIKFQNDICEECPLKKLTKDKHDMLCDKLPKNSWDKKTLLLSYKCLFFYKNYYNIIEIDVDKEILEEYKKAQKYMIKKIARKGVILELNPSSNLKIGNFKSLNDYFIENISNPKEEKLLVTINTDDPVVFGTTLKNEYSLIYEMFIGKGYGRSETLEWLDKIRKNGLEYNFIKDRGLTRNEIINEVKDILKRLDEV